MPKEVLLERPLGDVANITQVHEVVAQLAFSEPVGREAEIPGKLPHDSDVRFLGALRKAGELHVGDHALSEFGHGRILQ